MAREIWSHFSQVSNLSVTTPPPPFLAAFNSATAEELFSFFFYLSIFEIGSHYCVFLAGLELM